MRKNNVIVFRSILSAIIGCSVLASCGTKSTPTSEETVAKISDDSLFNLVQYKTFQYFWDGAEPTSGGARERYHSDNVYPENDKHVITSGGTGFGVMAILVGIERNFISRQQGYERLNKLVNWLKTADKFHGVWPHWWNGETGEVKPFSPKDNGGDLVETSYLLQGLLCVREYFKDGNDDEKALASRIDTLWRAVEFDWHRHKNVLYWHWSPKDAWAMNFPVEGYNECLIMYVLAAASPTHGIPAEVYHEGWARRGAMKNDPDHQQYGLHLDLKHNGAPQYGGPLFWSHYSFLGLDPRNLRDRYADYWTHNKNHTLINYRYCVENPKDYEGYGENCWGLTASYSINGYAAHSPTEDLGVISPTAALSSFPYTPEHSMRAMRHFYEQHGDKLLGEFGFYDAFSVHHDWYLPRYLAIDQGPIVVMMENYRTGLLWKLFMSAPEVQAGLDKLGFQR